MVKWQRKPIIQWIVCLYSTVVWFISYVSVSLIFEQHANDGHPDEYGAAHLCYLWCLLVYLIFCHATSPFFLTMKWCNGEMIPDGAVMMVILFGRGDSICALYWFFLLEWIPPPPGQFSWAKIVVGSNLVFPGQNYGGHVPGDGTVNFRSPGQLLTTLDTLLGQKLSR